MIALPTAVSYQRDQAEQPPNTDTDQHGRVRRTTQAISVAERSQDADQPHDLFIVDCSLAVGREADLPVGRSGYIRDIHAMHSPMLHGKSELMCDVGSSQSCESNAGCRGKFTRA